MAIILSVNAGSSSVKASLYEAATAHSSPRQLAEASVSGLTSPPALLTYSSSSSTSSAAKDAEIRDATISNQKDAFRYILQRLASDQSLASGSTSAVARITHVAHRVVHGGSIKRSAQRITRDTFATLEQLSDLAPLHNGAALEIVREAHAPSPSSSSSLPPSAINIAVFDSAFHSTLAPAVYSYAIAPAAARKNGLRRYGFHGLSYGFVVRAAARHLGKSVDQTSLIALHLGSGASACAVRDGRSVDTSMGLTPLSGLPGATRAGDVDAALVFHMTHDAGKISAGASRDLHVTRAEEMLNKEAGWKAMAGTADFGEVSAGRSEEARLAFDLFVDRIVGYVGSYYVKLDGRVDALVFAGGIGEKGAKLRSAVVQRCRAVGFEINDEANEGRLEDEVVSVGRKGAKHDVLVVKTDEQWEMARIVADDEELFNS